MNRLAKLSLKEIPVVNVNINCIYNDRGAWCKNKKVKRCLFGIGARECIEYPCKAEGDCRYRKGYLKTSYAIVTTTVFRKKSGGKKMKIESVGDLKEFFRANKHLSAVQCFVSTKVRRTWILDHEKTIQRGSICDVEFKNMGGGVWQAHLVKCHKGVI